MTQGAHYNKFNQLRYGNGCRRWNDCFTCPLPDCKFSPGNPQNSFKVNPITTQGGRHAGSKVG
jgi:hypothetical protein